MIGAIRTVVIVGLLLMVASAESETWFVERDGSGDYTTIQDAVNVAASGDTIRIGPGRFNEGEVIETPGWTEYVRVLVTQEELTFIGAGSEETIVGPDEPWDLSAGGNIGIEAGPYWGSLRLVVEDIEFENMRDAIRGVPAPEFDIRNCSFSGNNYSIYSYRGALSVDSCEFAYMPRNGFFIDSNQDETMDVSGCSFVLDDVHEWYQASAHVQYVAEAVFRNCSFYDGASGVGFVGVANAQVVDCLFDGQSDHAVACANSVEISIESSLFTDIYQAFFVYGLTTDITMRNTQIFNVEAASIKFDSIGALSVRNCILDKGNRWTIYQGWPCTKSDDLPYLDMTNNDWGTTCADSIEAWIEVCDYVVDYVPFVGQQVSSENAVWGDVKAMYRGAR